MSILEKMRGSTDSTPMQIVLILIVVAFIGWFSLPTGQTVQVAVDVNGERVLAQEYFMRVEDEKRLRLMTTGQRLNDEQEAALQNEVKDQIASDLVVAQEARKLGYEAHPDEVARLIMGDPRFQLDNGKFDKESYDTAQKNSGRSRSDFEADFRDRVLRTKLQSAVTLGVAASEAEALERYNEEFTTYNLSYVRIEPQAVLEAEPITPEEIATWAMSNAEKIQAAYDKDKVLKYDLPERVVLANIRLRNTTGDPEPLIARLDTIKAQLGEGARFEDLARRWSEDAGAPAGGLMTEQRVPSLTTKVREAIEGKAAGDYTDVIDEGDVVSLYRIVSRTPAEKIPLEDVRDELAIKVMERERIVAAAERVRDAWTRGPLDATLLEPLGASLESLDAVSPSRYRGAGDDPPLEAIRAVAELEGDDKVVGPFVRPGAGGEIQYIVRLVNENLPPEEGTVELPGGVKTFRAILTNQERTKVWDAYVASLRAKAVVDTGGGEATQGGWRQYLSWLLPDS